MTSKIIDSNDKIEITVNNICNDGCTIIVEDGKITVRRCVSCLLNMEYDRLKCAGLISSSK